MMTRNNYLFFICMALGIGVTTGMIIGAVGATPTADDDDEPGSELPASYYGEVIINDEPAPEGTVVTAKIDGEVRGEITVDESGVFGGPSAADEKLTVDGESEEMGEPVIFYVDDQEADAVPEVTWEPGDITEVDLSTDEDPPSEDPPSEDPPSEDPPSEDPPSEDPPSEDPPSEEPADISIIEASLSNEEIEVGDSVTITVTLENTGEESGEYAVELLIDDELTTGESIVINGSTTETVTFSEIFDEEGEYEVAVDDLNVGTITATEEDEEDGTEESSDEDVDDESVGFGILATLVSLLILVAFTKRWLN